MTLLRPAVLIAVLLLAGCDSSDHERAGPVRPDPIEAKLLTVSASELPVHEQVVGTVQPELRATVSAKVTGRLLEMHAVPGKEVAAGDLLARIETPQLEAALASAEAALANAESENKRYQALRDSGSVRDSELDRVAAALLMATAERDRIKAQLDDATVRAPFAGRITSRSLDTGDLVQPGTPICRIEDPTRLRLEIHAAEALASRFEIGHEIAVRVDSAGLNLRGRVAEISPAADSASRTFLVKLDLPENSKLLAGQFGRALIPRGQKSAVVVPPEALLSRGQMTYVGVVDAESVARLRIVRAGADRPEGVEILAGLESGERILAEIPRDLAGGTPVEVVP